MVGVKSGLLIGAAVAVMALTCASADAAPVIYSGFDGGWNAAPPVGPNSLASEQAFVTATGASNPITFANGSVPSGVSVSIYNPYGVSSISNTGVGSCGFALCGGDTDGNGWFLYQYGGSSTFTFKKPVSSFGAYFSGLQTGDTIDWTDSTGAQSITIPVDYYSGGMAFVGFKDAGQSITSVTVNSPGDIIGVDDVLYAGGGVPEPATWAMLILGVAMIGFAARRRNAGIAAVA